MRIFLFIVFGYSLCVGCAPKEKEEQTGNKKVEDKVVDEEEYEEAPDEWSKYDTVAYISKSKFPFNEMDAIEIYSYENLLNQYSEDPSLIVDGIFSIREQGIKEILKLSNVQVDTLEKILYGYSGGNFDEADCYLPRHTIVFYKKEKAITFLEICMQCNGSRTFDSNFKVGVSAEKMNMLNDFFKSIGITYFGPHSK